MGGPSGRATMEKLSPVVSYCFLLILLFIYFRRDQKDCIFIWNALRIIESHHRMPICNIVFNRIGKPFLVSNAHWDWLP
jgi:hypothetical protein